MFARCLFCHRDLPANEALEHFPVGRRVAFDPGRGRLWAVCPACRRWNLAPIEERWEALEELEKAVKDRARLLSQTDNIALLRTPELEIVRVGRANLTEEAWWRYGVELVRRRRTYQVISAAGMGIFVAILAGGAAAGAGMFGGWWGMSQVVRQLPKLGRRFKFGGTAWRGHAVCPRCGGELTSLPFKERGALAAAAAGDGLALHLRCLRCERETGRLPLSYARLARAERWPDPADGRHMQRIAERKRRRFPELPPPAEGTGFLITGVEAEHLMRRILAYQNYAGGKEAQVREATALIQQAGSAPSLAHGLVTTGRRLATIDATSAIALEIAVNEDRERRLLELELAELEQRWREEEEIAAIVDGELTWVGPSTGAAASGLLLPDRPQAAPMPGLLDAAGRPLAGGGPA